MVGRRSVTAEVASCYPVCPVTRVERHEPPKRPRTHEGWSTFSLSDVGAPCFAAVLMHLTHAPPAAACKISGSEKLMDSVAGTALVVLMRRHAWWSMHGSEYMFYGESNAQSRKL